MRLLKAQRHLFFNKFNSIVHYRAIYYCLLLHVAHGSVMCALNSTIIRVFRQDNARSETVQFRIKVYYNYSTIGSRIRAFHW